MNLHILQKSFHNELIVDFMFEGGFETLTRREWDVLLLIADDIPNKSIADTLSVASKSVKTYRTRIAGKLSLVGRDHLERFARKNKDWLKEYYTSYFL